MKRQMSQICVLFLILLSQIIVIGCGEGFIRKVNEKPDDDISQAIYEAIGSKKVLYWGKTSSDSDETIIYEYLLHDEKDENVLTNMLEAANSVMGEKETTDKIVLNLRKSTSRGGFEAVASLRTYYESEDGYELYGSFQTLFIQGTEDSNMRDSSPYDKLSTYINLPDIKSLVVRKKIAHRAEEEGIDWYEIWPDLEHYRVLEW
ncbi:MAG: hypothetical protein K2O59_07085 [Lachnospiraceae bacterium]|nr:hypothetical protein [Lachnospiraceae bacterium]